MVGCDSRRVAADCLGESMRKLMNHEWKDDRQGTVERYRKRYRREGYPLSTFLRKDEIKSGNNDVEDEPEVRVNTG